MRTSVKHVAAGAIAVAALASCTVEAGPVMNTATDKLISYFQAKYQLAATLQNALGGASGSSTYRLVAINGPAYPVGALISYENPLDLESRDCVLAEDDLPASEPWSSMPSWSSSNALDFGLGIPAPFRGAFVKAESSLDLGVKFQRTGNYGINDLSQVFMSRQELRTALETPGCADALQQAESSKAIFVRGLVSGRETLSSTRGFSGGIDVKVIEEPSGQFRLSYDSSGAFELSDDKPRPKFAIVAEVDLPEKTVGGLQAFPSRSMDDLFKRPSDETINRLAAIPES